MKVSELIKRLTNLPVKALNQEIYISPSPESDTILPTIVIEPITESCDDKTVIGYIMVGLEYDN